jgi:hypothetical protein
MRGERNARSISRASPDGIDNIRTESWSSPLVLAEGRRKLLSADLLRRRSCSLASALNFKISIPDRLDASRADQLLDTFIGPP